MSMKMYKIFVISPNCASYFITICKNQFLTILLTHSPCTGVATWSPGPGQSRPPSRSPAPNITGSLASDLDGNILDKYHHKMCVRRHHKSAMRDRCHHKGGRKDRCHHKGGRRDRCHHKGGRKDRCHHKGGRRDRCHNKGGRRDKRHHKGGRRDS